MSPRGALGGDFVASQQVAAAREYAEARLTADIADRWSLDPLAWSRRALACQDFAAWRSASARDAYARAYLPGAQP